MKFYFNIAILFFLMVSNFAFSALVPNLIGEQVGTLPKGRFMISAFQLNSEMNKQFNDSGKIDNISKSFNQKLTWNQIAEADAKRKEQFLGILDSKSISENDSAGNYVGDFKGSMQAAIPILGYGISDHLGVIAVLPVLRFKAQSSVAFQRSDSSQRLVSNLEDSAQASVAHELANGLNTGFESELSRAGYDYEKKVDRSYVGDLRLDFPYVPANQYSRIKFSHISTLIIPTGKTPDPKDLYGFSSGEGRAALGFREVSETAVSSWLSIIGAAGFSYKMPGILVKRVPRFEGDSLSPNIDSKTKITSGHEISAMVHSKVMISRSFSSRFGVQHQQKLKTKADGTQYFSGNYKNINTNTDERLDNAFVSLEFNSIQAFLDKDLPIPAAFLLSASLPIAGKNTLAEPMTLLQSSFFF